MSAVDARRLGRLDGLQVRRRREVEGGVGELAGRLVVVTAIAVLSFAGSWAIAVAASAAWLVMAGPWRFFWRPDSTLLARLPIDGGTLYRLGALRGARLGLWLLFLLSMGWGLVVLLGGIDGAARPGVRELLLVAGALATSALLAPPVTTVGGALVASPKAQRTIAELTGAGAQVAPGTFWLTLLPALSGCALVVLVLAIHAGQAPLWSIGATTAGAAVLYVAALPLAGHVLSDATREISALDQVRLAHVHLDEAKGLEAAWGRTAGGAAGRAIYAKDVKLARRRYPAYYLVSGILIVASWGVAALGSPASRVRTTSWLLAVLAVYAVIAARRLALPPVERLRLTDMLPLGGPTLARAKLAYASWRVVVPLLLAGTPALMRDQSPRLHVVAAAVTVGALVAAAVTQRLALTARR